MENEGIRLVAYVWDFDKEEELDGYSSELQDAMDTIRDNIIDLLEEQGIPPTPHNIMVAFQMIVMPGVYKAIGNADEDTIRDAFRDYLE